MSINKIRICIMLLAVLTVQSIADDELTPVNLGDIKVKGEMGRRIDGMLSNNILKVDIEKDFLLSFVNGKQEAKSFVGIGMMIEALVQYEQYTHGDPEVVKLKKHILETLSSKQDDDGYIGFLYGPIPERMCKYWSIHELSYINQGFVSDYLAFKNEDSLGTATKAADFLINNWADRSCIGQSWHKTQFIGLATAMIWMYNATGQQKYLDFVTQTLEVPKWDPIIQDHVYTHLSHCLEHLYLYRIFKDAKMLKTTDDVIEFITHDDGMLVTGGVAQMELWHNTQECSGNSVESCAVAYLLRLLHHRFLIQPKSLYGDIMERILYNSLMATQSPDCRQLRYHTAAEGPRSYYSRDYYCCPNNLRRIMPAISAMIYYSMNQTPGVIVNQYIPSEGQITLSDGNKVKLNQVTDYPYGDEAKIYVDPAKESKFSVKLRIPRWCSNTNTKVYVNDNLIDNISGGEFYEIDRNWKSGDTIRIRFPFSWRVIRGRKSQDGTYAIMRGPIVYTLNPEFNLGIKRISPQTYHRITIDPDTLAVTPSKMLDGVAYHACTVKGWWPGSIQHRSLDLSESPAQTNMEFTLTEFADPGGVRSYFKIAPGFDEIRDDELTL